MKNFNFDEWRRRYMRWLNHNKSRAMDFFRKMDKDHDGKLTREEFIEGVVATSKFLKKFYSFRFMSRLSCFLNSYSLEVNPFT